MTTVESSTELDVSFRNVAVVNYSYSTSSPYMVMVNVLSKILNVDANDINAETLSPTLLILEFSSGESSAVLFGNVTFPSDLWLMDRIVIRECKLKLSIISEIMDWFDANVLNPAEDPSSLEYYDKLLTEHSFCNIHSGRKVSVFVSSVKQPCVPEVAHENDGNSEFDGAPTITSDSTLSTTNFDFPKSSQDIANLAEQHSNTSTNNGNKKSSFSSNIISSRKRLLAFLINNDSNSAHNKNNSLKSKSSIKVNHNSKLNSLPDGTFLGSSSPTKTIYEEDEGHKQQSLNSILSKTRIYNKLKKNRESVSSTHSGSTNNSNLSRRTSTSTDASAVTSDSRRPHLPPINDTLERKQTNTNESIPRKVKPLPSLLISAEGRRENREVKFSYYCQLAKLLRLVENLIEFLNEDFTAKNPDNNKILQYLDFLIQKVFKFVLIDINQMILDYAQLKAYKICKTL